jgi:hypothetical protein
LKPPPATSLLQKTSALASLPAQEYAGNERFSHPARRPESRTGPGGARIAWTRWRFAEAQKAAEGRALRRRPDPARHFRRQDDEALTKFRKRGKTKAAWQSAR